MAAFQSLGQSMRTWAQRRTREASFTGGLGTGFLAGLIGVGGAEERVWILLFLLDLPLRSMFLINLLISLLTSSTSFTLRFQQGFVTSNTLNLAVTMIVTSPIGAYLGGIYSFKAPERGLRYFLASILLFVSIDFFLTAFSQIPAVTFTSTPLLDTILAGIFGFVIGVIAGLIGVAGGEYRIPVFVFVFGATAKVAGTASSLVAIPTLLAAIFKHRRERKLLKGEGTITLWMGAGSFIGVLLGVGGLILASEAVIRGVFAVILLYTSYQLYRSPLTLNQASKK